VQPVDPVEAWETPPFEPDEREGRIFARGASDNKGQTMYFLMAVERLISLGKLRAGMTVILEGEEECGSEGLSSKLMEWKELLKADVLMVCDTGALTPGVPFITMGLRGLVSMEITLGGIHHDLHSGALGGVVKNPATEMARLITSFHNPDGSIAVKGYYDQVQAFSPEDRVLVNASWPPAEVFRSMVGVEALGGELRFPPAERRGMRPTIEVNGLYSGYQGPGEKTIIPALATCKITSRLVSDQDPERCLNLLEAHVREYAPKGLELTVVSRHVGGRAIALSSDNPLIARARRVLDALSSAPTQFTWEGGSIPVVERLCEVSGATPLLVGFALESDRAHAPNESFAISQFELGFRYASRMLEDLGT
jgi:acetylornithine deacetylase/succinyl-diaminopimelate desuccinylase-like protein